MTSTTDADLVRGARAEHYKRENGIGAGSCVCCREPWPCRTIDMASRIEALSAEVAELELTAETARAQAKSALVLLEPLRAWRREYGEKCWKAGWEFCFYPGAFDEHRSVLRMHADLDALEREGM